MSFNSGGSAFVYATYLAIIGGLSHGGDCRFIIGPRRLPVKDYQVAMICLAIVNANGDAFSSALSVMFAILMTVEFFAEEKKGKAK